MDKTNKLRFSRIIVICNPASTHAHKVGKRIDVLRELVPKSDFLIVPTKEGGRSANRTLVAELSHLLGGHTLLCIAAGDGTANLVIEALLTSPSLSTDARRTVILPLWGGNANDLACMLSGTPRRANVARIATEAPAIAIRPLCCKLSMPDGTERIHIAACYASFGASAFAAQRLASPRMRFHPLDRIPGGRAFKEWTTVIRALFDAPLVLITQDERPGSMYEHIFLNGSRFAKVKGTPLKLTEPYFFHTIIRHKRARSVAYHLHNLTSQQTTERVRGRHASFSMQDSVWAQFDGEVFKLPAGTNVDISVNHEPFYALSTLLS